MSTDYVASIDAFAAALMACALEPTPATRARLRQAALAFVDALIERAASQSAGAFVVAHDRLIDRIEALEVERDGGGDHD